MIKLEEILEDNPVIPAVKNFKDLRRAVDSSAQVIFVLFGTIINIKEICEELKSRGKLVFIHIDMIEGLRGDAVGLEFIKTFVDPYGIITTKPSNIKHAKQFGLSTIQRIFIIDSLSLESGIKNTKDVLPEAVEVMPGVASKIIDNMKKQIHVPIIAGGLIKNKKDAVEALSSGATAVSTSSYELWEMES